MDEALRSLEQRARGDDVGALRALAVARERAGDARGAWRVRARLARATDAVEDWRALDPLVRAPREAAAVRALPGEGQLLLVERDGCVLHAWSSGLMAVRPDGEVRGLRRVADAGLGAELARCGSDVLVVRPDGLLLVDREGNLVAEAPFSAAGGLRGLRLTGDRAVVWRAQDSGPGRRGVLDVGEAFGEVVSDGVRDGPTDLADYSARVVAGRLLTRHEGERGPVTRARVIGASREAWAVEGEVALAADAAGAITVTTGPPHAVRERDLRTGEPRWMARAMPEPMALRLGRTHVVSVRGRLEARERGRGEVAWSAEGEDLVDAWVVGDDLLGLHQDGDGRFTLVARDLATGAVRWRLPLPDETTRSVSVFEDLWAHLVAADGALALQLNVTRSSGMEVEERLVWISGP